MYWALFLGRGPSPANWGIIATFLARPIAPNVPKNHSDDTGSYIAYRYVGDGAFVDPWLGLRPWKALALCGYAIPLCLGPSAVHIQKKEIEGNDNANITPLVIPESTENNNTFSPPPDKIDRPKEFLMSSDCDPCIARIPLRKLQELSKSAC